MFQKVRNLCFLLLIAQSFVIFGQTSSSGTVTREEFDSKTLPAGWTTIREPEPNRISLSERAGFLRLRGSTVTLTDTQVPPVLVGKTLTTANFEATATLHFEPRTANETAGIVMRQNERRHYEFGVEKGPAGREIYLRYVVGAIRPTVLRVPAGNGIVRLRVRGFPEYYRFSFSVDGGKFIELGGVETKPLFNDKTNRLEDVQIGLFASGNGRESFAPADFDSFEFNAAPADPYANILINEPTLPPGYTVFSVDTAERGIIKNYPFITRPDADVPSDVEAHRGLVYEGYGAREMHVDLFKPKRKGKFPAVIIVHGGAWITGHYTMENPLAIALAKRGYVAVTVEHRLVREKLYPAQIHDLKSAVRWLRANSKRFSVDPERIGAVGASSGGHLVALLGATNDLPKFEGEGSNRGFLSRVQSVVNIDGTATFTDPGNVAKEIKGPYDTNTRLTGFTYAQNPQIWEEASPITHVGPSSAPTLFLNSSSFRPFQQREEMSAKLNALGITSELVVVPDTPHPFWLFRPWFDDTVEHIDRFFGKTLRKK